MFIDQLPPAQHPDAVGVAAARDALVGAADTEMWRLNNAQVLSSAEDFLRVAELAKAEGLRRLAEADTRGLAPDAGSPTTAAWLVATLRWRPSTSTKAVRLARAIANRPQTTAALATGAVNLEQADVIATAMQVLPTRLDEPTLAQAEQTLIAGAAQFAPARLEALGARLRLALDPDGPEPDESEPDPTPYSFDLRTRADGACEGSFLLDAVSGLSLRDLIDAGSAPRPSTADGPDLRPAARRRADAFSDLVRRAAGSPEPRPGASRPSIAVTVTLQELRDGLPAIGPDGALYTAATLRRMSCDADILPTVLGSKGEVLDVGRRSRTVPPGIRRALIVRDQGCAFPGCDRPASWTEAHHVVHWAHHGETKITNPVLLCEHHHTTIHHRGWKVRINQHGLPEFTPPPWLRATG